MVYHQVIANSILYTTDPHRPLPHAKRPAYRYEIATVQVQQTISNLNAGNLAGWHYGDHKPRRTFTPPVRGQPGDYKQWIAVYWMKLAAHAGWRDYDLILGQLKKSSKGRCRSESDITRQPYSMTLKNNNTIAPTNKKKLSVG